MLDPLPAFKAQRAQLLAEVSPIIDALNDAIDLGIATLEEVAHYHALRSYRVALIRVEQQPGFPGDIQWPTLPIRGIQACSMGVMRTRPSNTRACPGGAITGDEKE